MLLRVYSRRLLNVRTIRKRALLAERPSSRRTWQTATTASHCHNVMQQLSKQSAIHTRRCASSVAKEEEDSDTAVEDLYTRKNPVEHVLHRPEMYVGPVERQPQSSCWVADTTNGRLTKDSKMQRKEYGIVPALIKIFDEILVNASDNRLRHPESCTRIDVTIHPGSQDTEPLISIRNDGKGIPVQIHKDENMYVPEMLFGHLLTGSNFDDDVKRLTGGRHGYGAKLSNIFSKHFTVETVDSSMGLRYKQEWSQNMTKSHEATVVDCKQNESDFTCVTFVPDLQNLMRKGTESFDRIRDADYAVMCRRVVDIAGCGAVGALQVTLNGVDVSLESFKQYANLYREPDKPPIFYSDVNDRWEVAIGLSTSGSFDQISFVNSIATSRGGTHVTAVVQQVAAAVQAQVEKLNPDLKGVVNQRLVQRKLFCCCSALIENPSFDSQSKELLTSAPSSWGSDCRLSKPYLSRLVKSQTDGGPGIVEAVIFAAQSRQHQEFIKKVGGSTKKTKRKLLAIPKLDEAHRAGTARGPECTMILTEGDSAKALAVAGLEVIGRELYGVFPLRGKFLNVRQATVSQLGKNEEVKALLAILGLDFKKNYETSANRSALRYGHVMIMTDQDNDGSHIKGLLLNFFRHFWPNLLKPPSDRPTGNPFFSSFVTPLLKATRKGTKEVLSFYTIAEYKEWRASLDKPDDIKKWSLKYYKGLGTSTSAEAKEYFKKFGFHVRPFHWNSDADGELIDMVFEKERASDRRDWILREYDPESNNFSGAEESRTVSYEDFVNKEMVHYSNADNIRSLPHVMDGLKPSQRKVLFACFKRKLKSEVKVAQLTGYCAEHTAYHHGEASLQSTITAMAQDFVGSNNINLLVPSGQFGTRLTGGKDAASPRYIFTHLSPVARYLFPEADDILLKQQEDDGQPIEPTYYAPIIPLLLVNGSQGIGTGWSTAVPPHDPKDIIKYIRAKLDNRENLPPIRPWIRGFKGSIDTLKDGSGYGTTGVAAQKGTKSVLITELPVGKWTNDYKQVLLKMQEKSQIQSFKEAHTTTAVSFTVSASASDMKKLKKKGFEKAFQLSKNLSTTNMNAFDVSSSIQKYSSPEDIADEFFPTRFDLYVDRKSVLLSEMDYNATMMRNKARFIKAVADGEIELIRKQLTKSDTIARLVDLGFDDSSQLDTIRNNNALHQRNQLQTEVDQVDTTEATSRSFDYLLNMPLGSLNSEKTQELQNEAEKTEKEFEALKATSPDDLWRQDLDKLEDFLSKQK